MSMVWNPQGYFEQSEYESEENREFNPAKYSTTSYDKLNVKGKKRNKSKVNQNNNYLLCPHCNILLKENNYSSHVEACKNRKEQQKSNIQVKKVVKNNVTTKKIVSCPICKTKFESEADLNMHKNYCPGPQKTQISSEPSYGSWSSIIKKHRSELKKINNEETKPKKIKNSNKNYSFSNEDYNQSFQDSLSYEELAYGRISNYKNKGDYEIRDNGKYGSSIIEDDIES